MKASRISDEYANRVEQFIQFTEHNAQNVGENFLCPCLKCLNLRRHSVYEIRSHLICDRIILNYTKWIWHGELPFRPTVARTELVDEDIGDRIEDMIHNLGQHSFQQAHAALYEKIEKDSKTPLYLRCTAFTRLSAVLVLVNLKVRFGWSDKRFIELCALLKNLPPKDNTVPKNHYEAKNILCPVGMEYQKIHACPNDCILYKNQFAEMRKCPTSGVSRYKVNNDKCNDDATTNNSCSAKVCWYLPIIPRFKRFFGNGRDAKKAYMACRQQKK